MDFGLYPSAHWKLLLENADPVVDKRKRRALLLPLPSAPRQAPFVRIFNVLASVSCLGNAQRSMALPLRDAAITVVLRLKQKTDITRSCGFRYFLCYLSDFFKHNNIKMVFCLSGRVPMQIKQQSALNVLGQCVRVTWQSYTTK